MASKPLFTIVCAAGVALSVSARARADVMPPEDPTAGAKSTAQWSKHLQREERERKLRYDRDRMKDHRAVLKFLVATRARYDRAKGKTAVLAIQKRLPPAVDGVRKRITRIDHWGTNSNLLGEYDAMLAVLSDGYPAALVGGNPAQLDMLRHKLDEHTRHIKDWLAEAAETEDE